MDGGMEEQYVLAGSFILENGVELGEQYGGNIYVMDESDAIEIRLSDYSYKCNHYIYYLI